MVPWDLSAPSSQVKLYELHAGTRNLPLCHLSTQGEGFLQAHQWVLFSPSPCLEISSKGLKWDQSVHCLLRSDLESFSREGFIPNKGQQPAQSKQIGEDEAPSDLPSAPSMPSVEELVCKHASGRRAMESCADEWRGSNPNCSALCFATFTHIHFPPAGCRVLYLQLPNYRSATACVLPRMRK